MKKYLVGRRFPVMVAVFFTAVGTAAVVAAETKAPPVAVTVCTGKV